MRACEKYLKLNPANTSHLKGNAKLAAKYNYETELTKKKDIRKAYWG